MSVLLAGLLDRVIFTIFYLRLESQQLEVVHGLKLGHIRVEIVTVDLPGTIRLPFKDGQVFTILRNLIVTLLYYERIRVSPSGVSPVSCHLHFFN